MVMPKGHRLFLSFPLVPFAALGGSFCDAQGHRIFLSFPLVQFAALGLVHGHVAPACRNSLLLVIALKHGM
jgi:hypothetical protein